MTPAATRERWRELAGEVLRKAGGDGAEPERALATTTYDGVTLAPLYDAADLPDDAPGLPPATGDGRPPGRPWQVRPRHDIADPDAVLADLANGAGSLWLAVAPEDLSQALAGVPLDTTPIVLDAGARTSEAAAALRALAERRGLPPASLRGCLGADPLGLPPGTPAGLAGATGLARAGGLPGMRAMVADATPYHEAGAGDAQELGCSIATGLAYLRALTDAGLTVEEAFGQIEFRYAATADQFATIAKFRAARVLWARVAEVSGGPPGQFQHAVTSAAMMARHDPHTNILRTTLACFAAGVGGADAVTVRPFDDALGAPGAFSRRLARNTSALLTDEAHVARVADPAGGSWYVERRTADLAGHAWEWFQEIEEAGGMAAALASGLVPERIAAVRATRARDIARGRAPIIGVTHYPDLSRPPRPAAPSPRPPEGVLPRIRHAGEYEDLRDLADARPVRPRVFLATLGPAREHAARTSFAAGVFHAGGIETVTGIPEEFDPRVTTVACLCGGDRRYAEQAAQAAAALRAAGATRIWLAGRDRHDGVDAVLHAGCDVPDVLRTTLADLEVTA
ncbi:methylmalonyl-CoA mutase [Sphaerisporangium siamense]|uniref:Methylmalonyl-CoA mutase n=1 Tax=Sphaerisporangium siamense TaxID=795645 RepID=A0A7W7D657_9ACTN|nr:methylmalonyl-CoA mutase subunit beta [Sphaerisporangium siamense]MBB4699633.1 methylmalonyl-CoA mutase [Sphaerisporangium siamense]GII89671.1 methylmalonyl-CoA mutase [Sphaerisporangium siamense]